MLDRCLDCRPEPMTAEAREAWFCGDRVEDKAGLRVLPAADDGALYVFLEPGLAKLGLESLVASAREHLRDHVDVVGDAWCS